MTTRVSDVIVPEIFSPYVQQQTAEKSRLVQSGALAVDAGLSSDLAGGGLTFNRRSFNDLDNTDENVSNDDPDVNSTPNKARTSNEIQVRLSRNNSWSSMDLTSALNGADPMESIANRVSNYWVRRSQVAFVATMTGVFANNATAEPGGGATQDDMTHDVSGIEFSDGVTNFSTGALIDATATMGDSMEDLSLLMVHSIVFARMQKLNLIEYVQPSEFSPRIPTFIGRTVIVDDSMPANGGVFESWLFGAGAVLLGQGSPEVPTEVDREPSSGNGGGQEILYNRTEWVIHPVGYKYAGTAADGGPSNAATANNLAHADSWERAWPERKQIKIARLITREL